MAYAIYDNFFYSFIFRAIVYANKILYGIFPSKKKKNFFMAFMTPKDIIEFGIVEFIKEVFQIILKKRVVKVVSKLLVNFFSKLLLLYICGIISHLKNYNKL